MSMFGKRIMVTRNKRSADRPFFLKAKLPVRQTLLFVGGFFVLIRPR